MIGAIIGDAVGSRFERHNIHTRKFDFLPSSCFLTDDSVMTIAIAQAILNWQDDGFFLRPIIPSSPIMLLKACESGVQSLL